MKNKWRSGYETGNDFEQRIMCMLDAVQLPYRKEKTLSDGRRRVRDKSSDIEVMCEPSVLIELKSTTANTNLTFSLYDTTKKVNIKPHQIHAMDWLILEYRPFKPIVISQKDFILWACDVKKHSIMYKDAKEIGFEMDDFKWLKEQETFQWDPRD